MVYYLKTIDPRNIWFNEFIEKEYKSINIIGDNFDENMLHPDDIVIVIEDVKQHCT